MPATSSKDNIIEQVDTTKTGAQKLLKALNDHINKLDDADEKKTHKDEFIKLIGALNDFNNAIEASAKNPIEPLPNLEPLPDSPSVEDLAQHRRQQMAREALENLPLLNMQARWDTLLKSVELTETLLRKGRKGSNPNDDPFITTKDSVIAGEIPLLIETVQFATKAVSDPNFASNDISNENSSFKTLNEKINHHIDQCDKNSTKKIAWGLLGASLSVVVGMTLIFIGGLASIPTLGASLGLTFIGVGIVMGGVAGSLGFSVISGVKETSLVARDAEQIFSKNIHGFHQQPETPKDHGSKPHRPK